MREDVSEEYGNSKNLEEYFHRIVFGNIFFFYSSETPEKLCIVSDTPRFPFGRDRIFLSSSKQDKRIETHLDCLHGRIDMAGSYSRAAEYVTAQQKLYSVSVSCIVTSVFFALFHLFRQPAAMAALVFFPAMIFGMLWDKYKNPYVCIGMHFWYNFTFFYF